ncbi:MAG: sigma factor-like helix-turn-helix DNA-binding protein [Ancalomicrobiaceae bacterium]|nr:sigma factor-like helix-turn-helix DNA-binding protein [Ancalomicrobiaceae bacterium]
MTGSTVDGEDVLQDALMKAVKAQADGADVDSFEGWLFRIAHNSCLDFLRARKSQTVVPLTGEEEAAPLTQPDLLAVGFQTFLRLPELQRCAVILKDVLGHSVEDIAAIADCSAAAAKSALQRGRAALQRLRHLPEDVRLPLMSEAERLKMVAFVDWFRAGDFDAIRTMLADDVKLDLVNRLKLAGRRDIRPYFTRYAEVAKWRYAFGAIEGRPAMLVFDGESQRTTPSHFVLVGWQGERIATIRDFLFAPYALDAADWVRLG